MFVLSMMTSSPRLPRATSRRPAGRHRRLRSARHTSPAQPGLRRGNRRNDKHLTQGLDGILGHRTYFWGAAMIGGVACPQLAKKIGTEPGIEPGTSCTQNRNHTSRPSGHWIAADRCGTRPKTRTFKTLLQEESTTKTRGEASMRYEKGLQPGLPRDITLSGASGLKYDRCVAQQHAKTQLALRKHQHQTPKRAACSAHPSTTSSSSSPTPTTNACSSTPPSRARRRCTSFVCRTAATTGSVRSERRSCGARRRGSAPRRRALTTPACATGRTRGTPPAWKRSCGRCYMKARSS